MPELSRDDYARHLNSNFITELAPGLTAELRLVEVSELVEHSNLRSYSLVFMAHPDAPAEPGVFTLRHEELGEVFLSLAPFRKDAEMTLFEAVFSQLIKK